MRLETPERPRLLRSVRWVTNTYLETCYDHGCVLDGWGLTCRKSVYRELRILISNIVSYR